MYSNCEQKQVKLTDIVVKAENNYSRTKIGDVTELANSIRELGVLEPVVVSEEKNSEGTLSYVLRAGFRRYTAVEKLGLETIPARIIPRMLTASEAMMLSLTENIHSETIDAVSISKTLDAMVSSGHKVKDIGQKLGKSEAWIYRRLQVKRMPQPVKDLLASGGLDLTGAHAVCKLGAEDMQKVLADIGEKGLNTKQIEDRVDKIQSKQAADKQREQLAPSEEAEENKDKSKGDDKKDPPPIVDKTDAEYLERQKEMRRELRDDMEGIATIFYPDLLPEIRRFKLSGLTDKAATVFHDLLQAVPVTVAAMKQEIERISENRPPFHRKAAKNELPTLVFRGGVESPAAASFDGVLANLEETSDKEQAMRRVHELAVLRSGSEDNAQIIIGDVKSLASELNMPLDSIKGLPYYAKSGPSSSDSGQMSSGNNLENKEPAEKPEYSTPVSRKQEKEVSDGKKQAKKSTKKQPKKPASKSSSSKKANKANG